jgi:hypothetical protein
MLMIVSCKADAMNDVENRIRGTIYLMNAFVHGTMVQRNNDVCVCIGSNFPLISKNKKMINIQLQSLLKANMDFVILYRYIDNAKHIIPIDILEQAEDTVQRFCNLYTNEDLNHQKLEKIISVLHGLKGQEISFNDHYLLAYLKTIAHHTNDSLETIWQKAANSVACNRRNYLTAWQTNDAAIIKRTLNATNDNPITIERMLLKRVQELQNIKEIIEEYSE